jgi:serine protease Do
VSATALNVEATQAHLIAGFATLAERLRQISVEVRGRRNGFGSGIVWRGDGLIVTNSHVVEGDRAEVRLEDGRVFRATLTRRERRRDLAALRIDARGLGPAAIGDSDALRVGELVVAVGNPLGHVGALATGIIHAAGRNWVKADVRLAPGNSGGLLANARGEVIGINSMIARGLALAVPSRAVGRFLAGHDEQGRPLLGVHVRPVELRLGAGRTPGLLVLQVREGGAADRAGILVGDIFIGAGGRIFRTFDDLPFATDAAETIELELIRGGSHVRVTVDLDHEERMTRGA